MIDDVFLNGLSALFGWVYTFCWSLSFYPQPLLNYRRKSTSGTTADFPLINVLGFFAYLISNAFFFYSPLVRSQYAARHHGLTPTVQFNDIMFALHALVLSVVTTSQYFPRVWGFPPSARSRPSRFILGVMWGCLLGVAAVGVLVLAVGTQRGADLDPRTDWCALDVIYAISYVKLLITLIKYTPQVIANVRNGSTKGWSIAQILLDITGGMLSIAQQGIDSWLQRDWSGITGNPVKFALGNVSIVYDIIFITQHYCIYPRAKDHGEAEATTPLLREQHRDNQERGV